MSTRFNILDHAKDVQNRGAEKHGTPEDSFRVIADFWNAYGHPMGILARDIEPYEVAEMMALFKQARNITRPNPDNYIDGINYKAIAADLKGVKMAEPLEPESQDSPPTTFDYPEPDIQPFVKQVKPRVYRVGYTFNGVSTSKTAYGVTEEEAQQAAYDLMRGIQRAAIKAVDKGIQKHS